MPAMEQCRELWRTGGVVSFARIEAKNGCRRALRARLGVKNRRIPLEVGKAKVILGPDLQETVRLPPICMHKGQKRARFGVFEKSLTPNHLVVPGGL